jgi:hypothetical protein
MIGPSNMNERLHGMTPNETLLDVGVSPKTTNIKKKRYNKHLFLIRLEW